MTEINRGVIGENLHLTLGSEHLSDDGPPDRLLKKGDRQSDCEGRANVADTLVLGDDLYTPEEAHKIATDLVEQKPDLLPTVVGWRWRMELKRGTVNFDPRNPANYRQARVGSYIKRIIPDRVRPDTEIFSSSDIPVYLPFERKYPSNFDFTMASSGQRLLTLTINGQTFGLFASNSPLAVVPHTLLVPDKSRPQYLEPDDIDAVAKLRQDYPGLHFVYSSMGGGAGVNHQHWHVMVGEASYPVLDRSVTTLRQGSRASIGHYPEWPTDCLAFEGKSNNYGMEVEKEAIAYLQHADMPHNVFISGDRTWIAPRSRKHTALIPGKKYGAWETILGVCNTGTQAQYDAVDEATLERALRDIQLEPTVKTQVVHALVALV